MNSENKYLLFLSIRGFTKRSETQKKIIKNLKLKKNRLKVMDFNITNEGLLNSNNLCCWTVINENQMIQIFNQDSKKLRKGIGLNNPKKGHICKRKYGFRSLELFKKEFIDRMYLRI